MSSFIFWQDEKMYLVHQSVEGRWKNNWGTREGGKKVLLPLVFPNPKRIWYPPLLYWHLSGGIVDDIHTHTHALLKASFFSIGLVTWRELCPWWLSFFFPIESRSLERLVCGGQLNSTRWSCKTVNDAASFLFFFPRVYIYIYIYAGCSSSSASYGTTSSSPYWMLPTKQLQLFFFSQFGSMATFQTR